MTTPPNKTTTETYWMIAVFKFGRWECDHGRFVDREDCEDWIKSHPSMMLDCVEHFPYRCTETIIKEYELIVTGKQSKDRKSTRLNSSHSAKSRMPSSA